MDNSPILPRFPLHTTRTHRTGKGTSFYSFLGVEPSATNTQISKAYRKRSLELHPDKNPGVPKIQERFARLGVVAQILRDGEKRERYNVSSSSRSQN